MAKIFLKGGTEHTLILGVREAYYQPFFATNWTDLRIGFFLSVTQAGADDTITGLTEEVGTPPLPMLPSSDRFALGIIDSATGRTFCGYSNIWTGPLNVSTIGTSKLVSSDGGITTSNAFFWRPTNEVSDLFSLRFLDGNVIRGRGGDGSQLHLPQDTVGAGGYATLVAMRFQRPNATGQARVITMTVKQGTHSGDILYTSTPTQAILETNLESFPTTVQQLGPVELSQVPDTLYAYWPFHNSRLRIHCYGFVKSG